MKFKYLSWDNVEKSCSNVFSKMAYDKYKPDIVIGLLWGGVVPTRLYVDFSDIKKSNVKVVYASLYKGLGERNNNVSVIPNYVKNEIENKKILIIDDILESGKTMNASLKELVKLNCSVKTATLVYKSVNNAIPPDYYDIEEKENIWYVYPWEKYEINRELNGNNKR